MIKKNNKKKKFGIIAISLAAISCIGVAFSTWVFGIVQSSDSDTIGVTMDGVSNSSSIIEIEAAQGESIHLAEGATKKEDPSFQNGVYVTQDTEQPDFDVNLNSFRMIISSDLVFSKLSYAITFVSGESEVAGFTITPNANDNFGRVNGATYNYIDLTIPNDIGSSEELATYFTTDSSSMTGYTIYTFNETKLSFNWSTYFGNASASASPITTPSQFYQTKIAAVDTDNDNYPTKKDKTDRKLVLMHEAEGQLDAMYDLFQNKGYSLKVTFTLETSASN